MPQTFVVCVLRQDRPGEPSYWQRFRVTRERDINVISVLQQIATHPQTEDGQRVAPVAWEGNCLEVVCGARTMLVNGRVRQACLALVDQLLAEQAGEIELRPLTKFAVIRDLVVNRQRLFRTLIRVKAWIPVDGYYHLGPGPKMSPVDQQRAYSLSQCMSCGCRLEACPQYLKIELPRRHPARLEKVVRLVGAATRVWSPKLHALSRTLANDCPCLIPLAALTCATRRARQVSHHAADVHTATQRQVRAHLLHPASERINWHAATVAPPAATPARTTAASLPP